MFLCVVKQLKTLQELPKRVTKRLHILLLYWMQCLFSGKGGVESTRPLSQALGDIQCCNYITDSRLNQHWNNIELTYNQCWCNIGILILIQCCNFNVDTALKICYINVESMLNLRHWQNFKSMSKTYIFQRLFVNIVSKSDITLIQCWINVSVLSGIAPIENGIPIINLSICHYFFFR